MPNSIQAIYVLIVLLPGFFVVALVELLTGISLLVSILLSLAINKDWMRLLRKIGLTRQSHDAQPWDGAFRLSNHWVLVKLGSGEKLVG